MAEPDRVILSATRPNSADRSIREPALAAATCRGGLGIPLGDRAPRGLFEHGQPAAGALNIGQRYRVGAGNTAGNTVGHRPGDAHSWCLAG